jgi:hypothetical protein
MHWTSASTNSSPRIPRSAPSVGPRQDGRDPIEQLRGGDHERPDARPDLDDRDQAGTDRGPCTDRPDVAGDAATGPVDSELVADPRLRSVPRLRRAERA